MHINSHFAIGMIIASISHYFIDLNIFEFILIVFFSFFSDLDVFFTKFAKDNNHRNLFTHSIYPGIFLLILGLVFNWIVLILTAFTFISHILIDFLDWGTNILYFPKKPYGVKYLISKHEEENLETYLEEYKVNASFFDFKYYKHRISLSIEVLIFFTMIIVVLLLAFEYILLSLFYFLGLYFHLSRHFYLKKIEKEYQSSK